MRTWTRTVAQRWRGADQHKRGSGFSRSRAGGRGAEIPRFLTPSHPLTEGVRKRKASEGTG